MTAQPASSPLRNSIHGLFAGLTVAGCTVGAHSPTPPAPAAVAAPTPAPTAKPTTQQEQKSPPSPPSLSSGHEEAVPGPAQMSAPPEVEWVGVPMLYTSGPLIAPLPGGDLLVAGDNDTLYTTRDDLYVLRLDPSGKVLWHRHGTGRYLSAFDVAPGHAFLGTSYSGQVSLGSVKTSGHGSIDGFLGKLDLEGNFLWGRSVGNSTISWLGAVGATPDGGAVEALAHHTALKYGQFTATPQGLQGTAVLKWTAEGELAWMSPLPWAGFADLRDQRVRADGSIVVAETRWKSKDATWAANRAELPSIGFLPVLSAEGKILAELTLGDWVHHVEIKKLALTQDQRGVVVGSFRGRAKLGSFELDPKSGAGFVATLGTDNHITAVSPVPRPGCLVIDRSQRILLINVDGVFAGLPPGAFQPLLPFAKGAFSYISGCALTDDGKLIVAGTGVPGAHLADKTLPIAPWLKRPNILGAPSSVPFVARIKL